MSQIHLRQGIFLPPFHPIEENPTQCLERDLELMVWLDKLGFHDDGVDGPQTASVCHSAGRHDL